MNMTEIKYFLDVAQTGNMSRSAERLHVAQPAISRSMKALEQELGAKLFIRGQRGMELSEDGRALAHRLAPVARELQGISQMFKTHEDTQPVVSIEVAAASEVVSDALALWIKAHPDCRVALTQGAGEGGTSGDIVIAAAPAPGSHECTWFSERIMLAARPGTFARDTTILFKDLLRRDFVSLPPAYGFSSAVASMCSLAGFKPRSVFESNNPNVVRKMVEMGLGLGFWPEKSWGEPVEHGLELYALEGSPKRDVCVSLTTFGELKTHAVNCYALLCDQLTHVFA